MDPITGLPVEIILLIIRFLSLQEVKQLSGVNKWMRIVCEPLIFRSVRLDFSHKSLQSLEELTVSELRRHILSVTYVVPEILKEEITEFRHFASSILTPAQYADESQLFLDHEQPPNPPFMVLFSNLRRICREQHSIIRRGVDQATLIRGFRSFSRLREFKVHFCSTLEQEDCFEYFIGMDMTMVSGSYIHHFRTISMALSCTKPGWLDVLHLIDLRIPKGHLTVADTEYLSRYLEEALWSVKTLKLTRSESAMQVLQYCDLKIT